MIEYFEDFVYDGNSPSVFFHLEELTLWLLMPSRHTRSQWRATYIGPEELKALFNNVSTSKYLSCMALHDISVFD